MYICVCVCVYLLSGSRATKLRSVAAGHASRTTRISLIFSHSWYSKESEPEFATATFLDSLNRLLALSTKHDWWTCQDWPDRPVPSRPVDVSRESRAITNLSLFSHATAYPLAEVGRGRQSCVCYFADDEELVSPRNFFESPIILGDIHSNVF